MSAGLKEQDLLFSLPGSDRVLISHVPEKLATQDWTRLSEHSVWRERPLRSDADIKRLLVLCASPFPGITSAVTARSLLADQDPRAIEVVRRLSAQALRLPRSGDDLVRFRAAAGLSDAPLRIGPSWIGGDSIFDARWIFPPAHLVPELLDDWFTFMWTSRYPWPMRVAIGVPQFLRIHPFVGGNGKTIRAFLIKLGFAIGGADGLALAIMLLLQCRREDILSLWACAYGGSVGDYAEALNVLGDLLLYAEYNRDVGVVPEPTLARPQPFPPQASARDERMLVALIHSVTNTSAKRTNA